MHGSSRRFVECSPVGRGEPHARRALRGADRRRTAALRPRPRTHRGFARLRRVNNPSEIDDIYMEAMRDSAMTDMVTDLIGPDVKYHHCKINLKLPGANTEVRYHQDFAYTPHTNDDVVTALLMVDDMTPENGCLMAVPGSHRGPMFSLFDGDSLHWLRRPRRGAFAPCARRADPRPRGKRLPSCTRGSRTARSRTGRCLRAGSTSASTPLRTRSRSPETPCRAGTKASSSADGGTPPGAALRSGHRAARAADPRIVLRRSGGGERSLLLTTSRQSAHSAGPSLGHVLRPCRAASPRIAATTSTSRCRGTSRTIAASSDPAGPEERRFAWRSRRPQRYPPACGRGEFSSRLPSNRVTPADPFRRPIFLSENPGLAGPVRSVLQVCAASESAAFPLI